MYTDHESGALKKLRRIQWPFQQTFGTPLRTIQPFSAAIVDALAPTLSARVVIDEVVFDPTKLQALLNGHRLSPDLRHDSLVVAETAAEVRQLLVAAFRDWV